MSDFAGIKGYAVAKRAIFILDAKGVIRYIWMTEDPTVEPSYDAIETFLQKMK
jgi:peroxiredoxin